MTRRKRTQIKKQWFETTRCVFALLIAAVLLAGCGSVGETAVSTPVEAATVSTPIETPTVSTDTRNVDDILASMTLKQKAAQMVQPAIYATTQLEMQKYCYGSVLSKSEALTYLEWQKTVDSFQRAAMASEAGIPFVYGQDDVHGVNYCGGAVMFPHNIGMGAANDSELMYQVGLATADEAKLCHMFWNFAPCVAQSADPRWGRTYESYGADLNRVKEMSLAYTKGLLDGGVIACPKHFFADGNVAFGTGQSTDTFRLMDRGEATLTDSEIQELLSVYQNLIDAGAQTVMVSFSALNGVRMHENAEYISYLKNEMGFKGFVVSDWKGVDGTSGSNYEEQLINCVNAGIDMFMEVDTCIHAMKIIVKAAEDGRIPMERVDDAVRRILQVKKDAGILDDPFFEKMQTVQTQTGSDEYRRLAEKAVEESLVLLRNEGNILPLKSGMKVYVTGPAASNGPAQCGGWSIDWNGSPTENITGLTTILTGLQQVAAEKGIEIITARNQAESADVVIAVLGEQPYAEWNGDSEDMDLCGNLGLGGNIAAIEEVRKLDKPSVACIVAGRQVLISKYLDSFDSAVMCYLPGTEGQGVANVLCGNADFTGTLPSPWYRSTDEIGTEKCLFPIGYGLKY